jgi:hypothetical protein
MAAACRSDQFAGAGKRRQLDLLGVPDLVAAFRAFPGD